MRGGTEGVNLVAQAFGQKSIGAGDEIILTYLEHHSNIVPWQLLAERVGAVIRAVPIDDAGELILEEYEQDAEPAHQDGGGDPCLQRPRYAAAGQAR